MSWNVRFLELLDQLACKPARPRPDADRVNRSGVDRDYHNIAAGLPRVPAEPQIGQRMAKSAVPAARQNDRQRDDDKKDAADIVSKDHHSGV